MKVLSVRGYPSRPMYQERIAFIFIEPFGSFVVFIILDFVRLVIQYVPEHRLFVLGGL